MKKCPSCNSSRITKQVIDGNYQISCAKCGFVNKRDLSLSRNKSTINDTFI